MYFCIGCLWGYYKIQLFFLSLKKIMGLRNKFHKTRGQIVVPYYMEYSIKNKEVVTY